MVAVETVRCLMVLARLKMELKREDADRDTCTMQYVDPPRVEAKKLPRKRSQQMGRSPLSFSGVVGA